MAPLSIRASTVRFSTAAVSGFKRKKKVGNVHKSDYSYYVIKRTPVLAWHSAGKDHSVTWEGKVEAEDDILLRKKAFKNKQTILQ